MSATSSKFLNRFSATQIGRRNWQLRELLIFQDADANVQNASID